MQQHTRRENVGPLVDPRRATRAMARSTHRVDEIARIAQEHGLVYAGSCLDDGNVTLVPVFYREPKAKGAEQCVVAVGATGRI